MRKLILASAIIPLLTMSAFADGTSALDKKDMKEFYTDEAMTTVKSNDDMAAAIKKMDPSTLARVTAHCKDVNSPRASFCESFNAINK